MHPKTSSSTFYVAMVSVVVRMSTSDRVFSSPLLTAPNGLEAQDRLRTFLLKGQNMGIEDDRRQINCGTRRAKRTRRF